MTEQRTKQQDAAERKQLERLRAGLMPFQLVKYFSFSSLAVILVFTLFLSWVISRNARDVMLDQSEAYSLLLSENLNQIIFRSFVLPTVVRYGKIALSNEDQFKHLDKIVRNATRSMKMENVTIFDSNVNIISYSTDEELVGKKDMGGLEYHKALTGEANSQIVTSGTLLSLVPWAPSVYCQQKTFIPFRLMRDNDSSADLIMGVIEITQDLSREYAAILQLQRRIILLSTVIMGIMFLVLRTIVSRADKIMEKRVRERLALEQELHKVERLAHLGTMVATVSHEIKSPLGIVRSTAEMLAKRIKKVAPGNENLAEIIVDETIRLNNIVMEFLDFARPQKVKLQAVATNRTVDQVLQFIDADLTAKNIELRRDFKSDMENIFIDQDLFYRALLNILVNAIQAMPHGGVLTVTTDNAKDDDSVKITIEDNGLGISEEHIGEIFKPFVTNKNKGTGLGLAITKNIIEQHHGTIAVTSKEGEGTVFTITLFN